MHTNKLNNKNRVYNYHFDNLVKTKTLKTKNIFIDEKHYKDLVIYFTRYDRVKAVTMLNLYCHKLMGKIKKYERRKCLMVMSYVLDEVLHRIKEIISIEKFDNTKILADIDDKLPDNITLANVVILMKCVIKDDGKLYAQCSF